MANNKNFFRHNLFLPIAILLFLVLFISMFSIKNEDVICTHINCGNDHERYFDALSAFFTMLAFVGVVFTLFLQWKDLKDTKEDIDEQNKTFSLQRFEHSFFTVLEMHNKLVDGFFIKANDYGSTKDLSGKAVLQFIANKMEYWAEPNPSQEYQFDFGSNYPSERYYKVFLDQYFGSFYCLYEHILDAPENRDKWYSEIVRSRLIEEELVLLYLHGIYGGPDEAHKFRRVIEKYTLLKNIGVRVSGPSRSVYRSDAYGTFY